MIKNPPKARSKKFTKMIIHIMINRVLFQAEFMKSASTLFFYLEKRSIQVQKQRYSMKTHKTQVNQQNRTVIQCKYTLNSLWVSKKRAKTK